MNVYQNALINIAEKITDIEIGGGDVTFLYSKDYNNINKLVERATAIKPVCNIAGYFCPNCDYELYNAEFCPNCGQHIIIGRC